MHFKENLSGNHVLPMVYTAELGVVKYPWLRKTAWIGYTSVKMIENVAKSIRPLSIGSPQLIMPLSRATTLAGDRKEPGSGC